MEKWNLLEGMDGLACSAKAKALDTLRWFSKEEPKKRQYEALQDVLGEVHKFHFARQQKLSDCIDDFRFCNGDKDQKDDALEDFFQQAMEIFNFSPQEDSEQTPVKPVAKKLKYDDFLRTSNEK